MPRLAHVHQSARKPSVARPTVSVALCTFNGERFVAEQLRSILAQSSPVDELVISDDGSTDRTLAIVTETLDGATPATTIRVTQNPSALGVTRNFEQAIFACTSELIVLCDQDDVWHPNRIESALQEFAARPDVLLTFSDANLVDESGARLRDSLFDAIEFTAAEQRAVEDGRALEVFLRRNVATGATIMFRRRLLELATPFPASWVHDEWLAMLAATQDGVRAITDPLIDYRQHGANEIGAARPTMAVRFDRLREPRRARNTRLLARAEALHERVAERRDAVSEETIERIARKVGHERFRNSLAGPRILRIIPVLRAAFSGAYREFGRARNDVLRDLVQPDR